MTMQGDKQAIVEGVLIWDGITRPEEPKNGLSAKYTVKIAVHPNQPEVLELTHILTKELNEGPFRGALPNGAKWGLNSVQAGTADGVLDGWLCMNAGTYNGAPSIYDTSGAVLQPMTYGPMIYPGMKVQILVHAYTANKAGNNAVVFGLDGIMIIDATTPRLNVGGSAAGASQAFGGGLPGVQPAAPAAVPGAAPPYAAPAAVPGAAPPYAAPAAVPGAAVVPNYAFTTPPQ